ncbi:MAG: pyrroline-5-carboxylate reductase dimerization domain-containing protein, partial [Candidatus Marinimicrobia bacterium]|nr:pyrroline-5-carboxylate reductase dimerization domain-containing protein [Candidatus Neomarinimicrobiota bacterium]
EIGFHSDEAFTIASQTARGAATLLLDNDSHPEAEIDQVTTPMGATIAGLNEMEHQGFSSAMIKGITTSTEKVSKLFKKD